MNKDPQCAGKTGYYVRLGFLFAILALLGGTLYYDRAVKIPGNDKQIGQLVDYVNNNFDGLTQGKVRTEAGFAPLSTRASGKFEVDHFRYSRTLPFLPSGQNVYVVYENGLVSHITTEASAVTDDALAKAGKREARKLEPDPNNPVPLNAGGGRTAAGGRGDAPAEPPPDAAPAGLGSRPLTDGPEAEAWKKKQEAEKAKADEAKEGDKESGDKESGDKESGAGDQPADGEPDGDGVPASGDDQPKTGEGDTDGDAPPAGESDPPPASGETGGGKDG